MTAAGETAGQAPKPDAIGGPVRYEKADTILRIALDMQGTAEGLSLEDIQRNYSDKPLSRRTAERLRDALERVFPQMQQANPGELPKRWRLPVGTVSRFASVSAEELADLAAGVSLLRHENMLVQAENAERAVSKLRALMRPDALTRVAPDLEALTEAEGIAMRPGPRSKIDPEIVAALRQAILASRKVKLHYKYRGSGKTGFDRVHPYGFIYGSRHYLVAWSENEQARDFRNFALSNIERVETLDLTFTRKRRFSLGEYSHATAPSSRPLRRRAAPTTRQPRPMLGLHMPNGSPHSSLLERYAPLSHDFSVCRLQQRQPATFPWFEAGACRRLI